MPVSSSTSRWAHATIVSPGRGGGSGGAGRGGGVSQRGGGDCKLPSYCRIEGGGGHEGSQLWGASPPTCGVQARQRGASNDPLL